MIPYVLRRLAVLPVVVFLVTIILFSRMWQLHGELRATTDMSQTKRILLANVPPKPFVLIASDIGAMVVLAAVFTFLGLSGRRGLADWGYMLNIGRNWIIGTPSNAFQYWYVYLPPIAAIVLFSVGWNLIGDGLRDALDPRAQ